MPWEFFYPHVGRGLQHSSIMHDVQREGPDVVRTFLAETRQLAGPKCDTVLLSGEDFENCIVDVALAGEIEAAALEAGFSAVNWVVVVREQESAVRSLYGELSSQGVVMHLPTMQRMAKERGCIYVSSVNVNYIFVLDFERFRSRFEHRIAGEVLTWDFAEFVRDYPGMVLLRQMLSPAAFVEFTNCAQVPWHRENVARATSLVETRYLLTALNLPLKPTWLLRLLLAPLIVLRLRKQKRARVVQGQASA